MEEIVGALLAAVVAFIIFAFTLFALIIGVNVIYTASIKFIPKVNCALLKECE